MNSIAIEKELTSAAPAIKSASWLDRISRSLLLGKLRQIQDGRIELTDSSASYSLGDSSDTSLQVKVHQPDFYRHAVLGGSLSVAESYLRGDWDCEDLTSLFRLLVRNMPATQNLDRGFSRIAKWIHRFYHAWHSNSKSGSRRNIQAHYDLGNKFFQLMLDETMSYSSGIFAQPTSTLQEASVEKMDRICQRLDLKPGDHLVEIGTGWGGLAIHAASHYGCKVTSTTISQRQCEFARQRVEHAGLSDRVELLLTDYRDLQGSYDKLVSVEMIEAVGHRYLDTYFQKCSQLLKPGGTFVLQGIVMPDRRYTQYLKSVDFIQKYVFPGGCLTSLGAMLASTARVSDFRLVHCEDFGPHYARTLREWRSRFHWHLDEVRKLGYPERFIRLWHYYLCYCEAAFEERYIGVVQVQFDKPTLHTGSGLQ